jgi:hypothetical protein
MMPNPHFALETNNKEQMLFFARVSLFQTGPFIFLIWTYLPLKMLAAIFARDDDVTPTTRIPERVS